jgi:hypothetical protein
MGDIIRAMEIEKEYISFRAKDEEPYAFVDKVKECGFGSISEYSEAKRDYLFANQDYEFIFKDPDNCIQEGLRLLDTKTTAVVFVDCNETFVYTGESKPYNEEYCKENNIPVYPLYAAGGAIVGVTGDFSMGICIPESLGADDVFVLNKLKELLSQYISVIEVDGNDVLQNGMKIVATTSYRKNGMFLFIAHFSFSDREELIGNICISTFSRMGRVREKIPYFIEGLTREQLKQEVEKWLSLK